MSATYFRRFSKKVGQCGKVVTAECRHLPDGCVINHQFSVSVCLRFYNRGWNKRGGGGPTSDQEQRPCRFLPLSLSYLFPAVGARAGSVLN